MGFEDWARLLEDGWTLPTAGGAPGRTGRRTGGRTQCLSPTEMAMLERGAQKVKPTADSSTLSRWNRRDETRRPQSPVHAGVPNKSPRTLGRDSNPEPIFALASLTGAVHFEPHMLL